MRKKGNKQFIPGQQRVRKTTQAPLKIRVMAGLLAVATAGMPVLSYAAESTWGLETEATSTTGSDSNATNILVSTKTDGEQTFTETEAENVLADTQSETSYLFLNLATAKHGKIVVNEGQDKEQTVRIETLGEKDTICIYDKDDSLMASYDAAENSYTYAVELQKDSIASVKAISDDGYEVKGWSLHASSDEVAGENQDMGYDGMATFDSPVFMDENKTVAISFAETEQKETTEKETEKGTETQEEPDLSVSETEAATETAAEAVTETGAATETETTATEGDLSVSEPEKPEETEAPKPETGETEPETEQKDLSVVEPETETDSETEPVTEQISEQETEAGTEAGNETEPVSESETEPASEAQPETGEEHFLEENLAAGDLDGKDFSNARLIVMANDASVIVDPEHQVGNYENLYLLQYDSPEQAINAYLYYLAHAEAVEPDEDIQMAGEMETTTEPETGTWTEPVEGDNALTALNEKPDSPEAKAAVAEKVIALVDTGASNDSHLVGQVSLIDDTLAGNGHADEMLQAITSQNQDAKVLSIRVMDDSGKGTISSVVAGMEYAMQQQVSIINLSLYAKKSLRNAVLEAKIQEAVDKGITVVGAAGNDGANVENYIPGCVDSAYIIGAAEESGCRLKTSNYGDTVDYFVMAGSTSEATALFSGYVSANGLDAVSGFPLLREGLAPPQGVDEDQDSSEIIWSTEDGMLDPVMENYVMDHADAAYTKAEKTELVGGLLVKQTFADANRIDENSTLDTLNCTDEILSMVGQVEGLTAIYNLSDDSEYYVAYADSMLHDDSAKAIDVAMAYNNDSGCTFNDYHYDYETGMVYIPKARFKSGNDHVVDAVQIQILQMVDVDTFLDDSFKIASTVTALSDDSDKTYKASGSANIFDYATNIKVEKNLEMDKMVVAVNGCPIPSESYIYDPVSGNLGLYMSSAAIQNIAIHSKGRDENQVSPAATYATMAALNTTSHRLPIDADAFDVAATWQGTIEGAWHDNEATGDWGEEGYVIEYSKLKSMQPYYTSTIRYMTGYISSASKIRDNTAAGDLVHTDKNQGRWTFDVSSIQLTKKNVGSSQTPSAVTDPGQWSTLKYKSSKRLLVRTFCSHISDKNRNYGGKDDSKHTGGIGHDAFVAMKKAYPDIFTEGSFPKNKYTRMPTLIRLLNKTIDSKGNGSIVFGLIGQREGTQNGVTIMKLFVKNVPPAPPVTPVPPTPVPPTPVPPTPVPPTPTPTPVTYVRIAKRTSGGNWINALTQAEFTLYEGNTPLETIRIQNSDWQQFSTACLVGHTYRISETKVPDGMTAAADATWTASEAERMHQIWFYDGYTPYYVKVKKTSTAPTDILALSGYSLAGAQFGVYADAACTQKLGTLTTDENGDTGTLPLTCTNDYSYTYFVKEETAPAGHSNTGQIKQFTIKLPDDVTNKVRTVEFSDDPVFTQVDAFAQKLDMKNHPVPDVVFKVCLYDGEYATVDACPGYALKKTWYLKSKADGTVNVSSRDDLANDYHASDSFYTWNGQVVVPIGCTLTYQEVKAPSKYVVDDTTQIWSKQGQTIQMKNFTNDLSPSKIKLKKLDTNGKTPLSGVTFELKFVKESSATTAAGVISKSYIPLLKQGESIQTTTDAAGNIEWGNLDQGEYEITEVKTISGHTLLKDPIHVTLPITMTDKQAKAMSAATDQGKFDDTDGLWYFFEATYEVTNTATFSIPTTGGNGVWVYGIAGFGLAALVCGGLLAVEEQKRKKTKK